MLIIGGTGDLSRRHLLPALTRLLANGELAPEFSVILTGRESMSTESCRALLDRELSVHAAHLPAEAQEALVERTSYLQADVREVDALRPVDVTEPLLTYVATPPAVVPAALDAVLRAGAAPPSRIVLDKPFGLSRASARALNARLHESIDERYVFRVDHFLYHHVVQELVRWRHKSDPLSLVDLLPTERVDVLWDETRPAPTDPQVYPGAMRDMVQSHLLQLVAVVTMDSPESLTRADIAERRLAALRGISVADVPPSRARHVGGSSTTTPSTPPREAETLVTLALRSRTPRWRDVGFFLRAAKGVEESCRRIALRFPHRPLGAPLGYVQLDVLTARVVVGLGGEEASSIEFSLPGDAESPSTRLLRAALIGDDTFTLRPEEPEESWRIVEAVLEVWDEADALMPTYRVGTSVADIPESGADLHGA